MPANKIKQTLLTATLLFLYSTSLFSQNRQEVSSSHTTDKIIVETDTLYIINYAKVIASELYTSEISAAFLLRFKNNEFDTLLIKIPESEDFGISDEFVNSSKFYLDDILLNIKYGESNYDEDSTRYQFFANASIEHIDKGVFHTSHCKWSYTGGAHGYGECEYAHYDFSTKQEFYFNDVFKEGATLKIFKYILKEDKKENPGYSISDESYEIAMQNLDLSNGQYIFTKDGIEIHCQMYDTLFGIWKEGYTSSDHYIPYAELKKYMKKDSPIYKMLR